MKISRWENLGTTFIHGTLYYVVRLGIDARLQFAEISDALLSGTVVGDQLDEVLQWVHETFQDEFGGGSTWQVDKSHFYFQNEHDRTLFLMKWS